MSITKVQINRATVGNLSGSRSFTSSSLASRVTTEATNVDNLQTDSGSFSTRVTDLVTASSSFSGSIATLRGAGSLQGVGTSDSPTFAGATITGTLTAQEIHTEFESASILFSSGSTIFGDTSNDIHRMTGSLNVSGALNLNDGDAVFGATATVETGLNLESGTLTVKNATSDSNGLKISQGGSDASNILNHYNGTLNLGVANSVDMTLKGGLVGIGTDNPTSTSQLHVEAAKAEIRIKGTNDSASDEIAHLILEASTDRRAGITIEGDSNDIQAFMGRPYDTANTLVFETDATERMRITADGNITTVTGSALSYQSNGSTSAPSATTPVVFTQTSASLVQIDDSNNRYKKMFSHQVAKSGTARIKFTARNVSGTYYWSWLISRNNGSGSIDVEAPTAMKLHNGNTAAGSFGVGLANGESASVHNFRKFDISVKDVVAGDFIELWMRSSDGSGGQVTGNGQDLLAKDFQILSTTPSIESNAILPGTPKGQGLWEIIDKVVLTSNTSILSHPTCFANGSKYSHFKIVVGWLGTTAQESIFMRFLYNGGSSAYSAAEYYNTKVQTEHDTTSLSVEIQNATSHIDLFNQTNTTNIGGVHGEIKIYNISAPIIRNGHNTRLQDVDTNRGTAYRAIGRSVLFGYDDDLDSYGQQVTNFRWNTSEVANDTINGYSGFQMFPGSGNFYAQSYVIICGFRVDDEYTLGTTDI